MVTRKYVGTYNTTSFGTTDLWNRRGDQQYSGSFNLGNMQAGDQFEFKLYLWDDVSATFMYYDTETKLNAQTKNGYYFPPMTQGGIKLTVEKKAGQHRAINWTRFETSLT